MILSIIINDNHRQNRKVDKSVDIKSYSDINNTT